MVNGHAHPQGKRVPYKTYLSLFPIEWAKLKAEAERRKISGREVIESALSSYCGRLPAPSREEPPPLPDPPPDLEPSQEMM